jgi:hypothetical protein
VQVGAPSAVDHPCGEGGTARDHRSPQASRVPEAVPKTVPETAPQTAPQTVPETVPETVLGTKPETVTETVLETVPESAPETVLETVPEPEPESVTETHPKALRLYPKPVPETPEAGRVRPCAKPCKVFKPAELA